MAVNPWDTATSRENGGGIFGTGDAYGATDVGHMDALAIQNNSHTGPQISETERQIISDRVAQMVAEGRDVRDIPSQFPGVDANLINQYIQQAQTRQDLNPFDNTPGVGVQPPSQQEGGQGFFAGLLSGFAAAGAAVGSALGSAKDSVVALGQRLLNSGVEMEPRDISLAELGNLTPNLQVGKARSIDGPQVG